MRIQETDRILKESRNTRHAASLHHEEPGVLTRAWQAVQRLFHRSNETNGGR